MAAYRQAHQAYRYYECEGQRLCAAENQIAGWIDFLAARPRSPRAGAAVARIVMTLDALGAEPFDARAESPAGLLRDVAALEAITPQLAAADGEALRAALAPAKVLLENLAASRR
jgi:hypothetical protein